MPTSAVSKLYINGVWHLHDANDLIRETHTLGLHKIFLSATFIYFSLSSGSVCFSKCATQVQNTLKAEL